MFPNYLKDKKAMRLIQQLLHKVPEIRLGGSYGALKANAWFENFDWDKLIDQELKAPYIPSSEKMISEADIKKYEAENRLMIDYLAVEQEAQGRTYNKESSNDPNWDKDF